MEISCMRDISLVLLLFLSLVCIIKGLFFAPNKSARAILCVDTSPTSLSAVQYPCSSAGSNELYYPRADIIGKQKLKKKKKKCCWRLARRSQVFRMRHNQSACPQRSHVAASLMISAIDKRASLCADGPPAVTRSEALYTLRPSCHRTSVTKRICNAIWWEKMLQPCRDHWHPAAVLCGMFCGLGDVYSSA